MARIALYNESQTLSTLDWKAIKILLDHATVAYFFSGFRLNLIRYEPTYLPYPTYRIHIQSISHLNLYFLKFQHLTNIDLSYTTLARVLIELSEKGQCDTRSLHLNRHLLN